jgi:hypothetical protein
MFGVIYWANDGELYSVSTDNEKQYRALRAECEHFGFEHLWWEGLS